MTACDVQPVVLLTDIMEPNSRQDETILGSHSKKETLFHGDQTEPLNLCLNGSGFEGFAMVDFCPKLKKNENFSNASTDDDVMFVKEFKLNGERAARKQKVGKESPIRKNPLRKARASRKFHKEYTGLGMNENYSDDGDEEEALVSL